MKVIARKVIPMWVYRRLSRVYSYLLAWREGPICIAKMAFGSGEMTYRFSNLAHPFTFRLISEDKNVVLGNIIRNEALEGPLPDNASFIVDAGCYIGDTAALFLSRYHGSTCVALEPGSAHGLASRNLARYGGRAILLKAALMGSAGTCKIDEADTGTQAVHAADGDVVAVTMAQLLELSPHGRIDILKVDIEGAENELFDSAEGWLHLVDCITIELHGDRAKHEIPKKLKAAGFELSQNGYALVALRHSQPDRR
jgi:FkbM family methyltransferase